MSNKNTIRKKLILIGETAPMELKKIDFKEKLDINKKGEWCELIKDIIALANCGGGILLIGVQDDGSISSYNHKTILNYDTAKIADKISGYLDIEYTEFEVVEIQRTDGKVTGILCFPSFPPRIFKKAGDYSDQHGKQKSAFQKGILYTRRGTRSIPAQSSDLLNMLNVEINNRKKSWLGNIKKIVQSPFDYDVHLVSKGTNVTFGEGGTPVRITDNPNAPEFKISNPDKLCPFNTTKTVEIINKKLKGRATINFYDIILLRYQYKIDKNPEYYYHPISGASQYSNKLIDWVIKKFNKDNTFFKKNREKGKTKN